MILDRLANGSRYVALHPGFWRAFRFLEQQAGSLPDGRHAIDADRLFVILGRDAGKGSAAARLEAHRRYIDIQYVIEGTERIGWKPTPECTVESAYDPPKDIAFFAGPPHTWLELSAGMFVVFFPEDAHAPLAGQGSVRKAVVKVALDWLS